MVEEIIIDGELEFADTDVVKTRARLTIFQKRSGF